MPKCSKVKNPCKICLQQVTTKNGLQCQGACKTWLHYSCLNYTPGKIKDIKAGIICVTCPCPDCKSQSPREYRIDDSYSCSSSGCPANTSKPAVCENKLCPAHSLDPPDHRSIGNGCALSKCGKSFIRNSAPHLPAPRTPQALPNAARHKFSSTNPSNSAVDMPGDYASPDVSLSTIEQMCATVGQLTNQINDLLTKMKMKERSTRRGGCGNGSSSPTKSYCSKSCNCSGNRSR